MIFLGLIVAFTGIFLVVGMTYFRNSDSASSEEAAIALSTSIEANVLQVSATGEIKPKSPADVEQALKIFAQNITQNAGKDTNGSEVCAFLLNQTVVVNARDNRGEDCPNPAIPDELTNAITATKTNGNPYFVAAVFIQSSKYLFTPATATAKDQVAGGAATTLGSYGGGSTMGSGTGAGSEAGATGAGGLNQMGGEAGAGNGSEAGTGGGNEPGSGAGGIFNMGSGNAGDASTTFGSQNGDVQGNI